MCRTMKYLLALCASLALAACQTTEYSNTQKMEKKDSAAVANATQGINEM